MIIINKLINFLSFGNFLSQFSSHPIKFFKFLAIKTSVKNQIQNCETRDFHVLNFKLIVEQFFQSSMPCSTRALC